MKPITPCLVLAASLFTVTPAGADDPFACPAGSIQWTGNAGDGKWSTAGNWSSRKVPGPTSDVCIPTFGQADATVPVSIHSLKVTEGGTLILLGSGQAGASFNVATSLSMPGFIEMYDGTTLTAGSIDMPNPGDIEVYGNSTITSPAFSNSTGSLGVDSAGTLRLTYDPVQLQNGNLSGGNWYAGGVLIIPSDISQITTEPGAAFGTTVEGSIQDASGNNALATLTTVGLGSLLSVTSLTLDRDFAFQGRIDANSLTINGTYTIEYGGFSDVTTLTANSVIVQPGGSITAGTVASSVTNNGTVSLWGGTMTVTGNYTQTAGGALSELFYFSTLNVKQTATLSGALNVQVNPKHPPPSGAQYTALTAGTLSGAFTSHTAGFTLTTRGNSIQVTKQ